MFHLVRGGVYLLVVLGASFSFLYTSLVTILLHTLYFIFIYMMIMYVFFTYLYMCCFFSLFIHMFFMYATFIFVSHLMPWWVLFKCFRMTGYECLPCHELSSCKVFQEFVLGLDLFVIHKCYEFSDLRLLSWIICFVVVLSWIGKWGDC